MDLFTLMGKIVIESGESTNEIDAMIEKAKSLGDLLGGTTNTAENTSKSIVASTKSAATGVGKAVSTMQIALGNLATQGFNKLVGYGKSFFQTGFEFNQNMEKWTASFKTYMGGDLEKAQAFMEEVRQFAIDTPLSLESSVQSAVRLMASGVESSDIIDTLSMLGDIANGDTEKMSRLGLVLSQVLSAKKLKGNDPNQFKEAGVPIYDLLLDYYHANGYDYIDSAFLMEMQAKGGITSDEVLGALKMATSPGGLYYNAMNNIMDTEYGKAQKMQDAYEQAAGAATKAIFDVFSSDTIPALSNILERLNEWATKNPDALKTLAQSFSDLATNGIDLLVGSLTTLLDFWNNNQEMFNGMLMLFGGLAISKGKFGAGMALLTAGGYPVWDDWVKEQQKEFSGLSSDVELPFIKQQLEYQGQGAQWEAYLENWKNSRRTEGYSDEDINGFIESQFANYQSITNEELQKMFGGGSADDGKSLLDWLFPGFSWIYDQFNKQNDSGDMSGSLRRLQENMHNTDMLYASTGGKPDGKSEDSDRGTVFTLASGILSTLSSYSREAGRFGASSVDFDNAATTAASIQAMAATVQSLAGEVRSLTGTIPEAIASGISGITVTGHVSTGNVTLNTGALVGHLTPSLNLALGSANKYAARGVR